MINIKRTEEQRGKFSFDGENKFPRIERLISRYRDCVPEVDVERAVIYTKSYKESEGEDVLIRRAKAFYDYCAEREINIPDDQLIVGDTAKHSRGGVVDPVFHAGWFSQEAVGCYSALVPYLKCLKSRLRRGQEQDIVAFFFERFSIAILYNYYVSRL